MNDLNYTSLLGGAIGDSLGADIEFKFGERLSSTRPLAMSVKYGPYGAFTDDTQMTLFTAEGVSRALTKSNEDVIDEVTLSLLGWYGTQIGERISKTPLARDNRMKHARAPGNSCMQSLSNALSGKGGPVESIGCGTIMRVAPVALAFEDPERVFEIAIETSRITHDHIEGYLPAAIWAVILNQAKAGVPMGDIIADGGMLDTMAKGEDEELGMRMMEMLRNTRDFQPKTTNLNRIRIMIQSYGSTFHAENAMYVAFAACMWGRYINESYMIAVNNDSDSDTTGAIAGNLLGILYPDEILNSQWTKEVECLDLIRKAADSIS